MGRAQNEAGEGVGREIPDDGAFEREVLGPSGPVLVAFTAEWCAPCRWLYPYLGEIREREGAWLEVVRADVDRLPASAERFRIGSVPTVLLLVDGAERGRSVGVEPDRLRELVGELRGSTRPDGG